jgi:hypothetical protein
VVQPHPLNVGYNRVWTEKLLAGGFKHAVKVEIR